MAYDIIKNKILPVKILEYNYETGKVEFVDQITTYKDLRFVADWEGVGSFTLTLNADKPKANELLEGRFIQLGNDTSRQGVIQKIRRKLEVTEAGQIINELTVSGVQLKGLLMYSLTVPPVYGDDPNVFPTEDGGSDENMWSALDADYNIVDLAVLDYYGLGITHHEFDSKEFVDQGYSWRNTERDYWEAYGIVGGAYDVVAVDENDPASSLPNPSDILEQDLLNKQGNFRINTEAEGWEEVYSQITPYGDKLRIEQYDPTFFEYGTYYETEQTNGDVYYVRFNFQQAQVSTSSPTYEGIGGVHVLENNIRYQRINLVVTATETGTVQHKVLANAENNYERFEIDNFTVHNLTQLKAQGLITGETNEELQASFDELTTFTYSDIGILGRVYLESLDEYSYHIFTTPKWRTEDIMRELVEYSRKYNILYFQRTPIIELEPKDWDSRGIDHEYESFRFKKVSDVLEYLSNASGLGWNIVAENEKLWLRIYDSTDRTTEQNVNNPVIFSFNRGNIKRVEYEEDLMDSYNQIIVAGGGDGTSRDLLVVGDFTKKGVDSRLGFVDARDVKTIYGLETRALQKISEKGQSQAINVVGFTKKVLVVLNEDYELGDRVTIRIDEWGLVLHVRVLSITERQTLNNAGTLEFEFGTKHLSLDNLIRRNFLEFNNEILK